MPDVGASVIGVHAANSGYRMPRLACIAGAALLLAACEPDFSTAYFRGEPTRTAYALLKKDPQARAALGEPIKIAFASDGVVTDRDIKSSIAVSGPRARGTLYIEGSKHEGEWRLLKLQLSVPGRAEPIDILPKP